MPSAGVLLMCAAIGAVLFVGDKVVHLKPVQKTNHAICRVVTIGQKCKPKPRAQAIEVQP
jgi:hypothetical protein